MTIFRYFPAVILALFAVPTLAADANGYTAQYECRAGNPNCDVDVQGLAALSCDQTIAAGDAWSTINWSNRVICLAAGDHTAKGTLTLGSPGTSGTRKVLRYYRSSDNDDEPWNQGSNQAKVSKIDLNGNSYWIMHRITVQSNNSYYHGMWITGASNIINRVLVEGAVTGVQFDGPGSTNNTVQNGVFRNCDTRPNQDTDGIALSGGPVNTHIVNNELYGCGHQLYISEHPAPGTVFENNDIYTDSSQYTDCNGNYTPTNPNSPCAAAETPIATKAGGSQSNPSKYVHNRVWGARSTDTNVCCIGGSQGTAVGLNSNGPASDPIYNGAKWVLLKDNIITDSQYGMSGYFPGLGHNSIVGNIIYGIKEFDSRYSPSAALADSGAYMPDTEFYLNTIIDTPVWYWGYGSNHDLRCNVIVASGPKQGGGTGTQFNYNAYYGTVASEEASVVAMPLSTRQNATAYAVGDVIRLSSNPSQSCKAVGDQGCYLYRVTQAGISATSSPAYCTTLGCEVLDGSVQLQAIRGPYAYKRKLHTVQGGETRVIAYARAHTNALENRACDPKLGSRPGIGISDGTFY